MAIEKKLTSNACVEGILQNTSKLIISTIWKMGSIFDWRQNVSFLLSEGLYWFQECVCATIFVHNMHTEEAVVTRKK